MTAALDAAVRVMARADELAACTERPGEITRRYGTPALLEARGLLDGWMRAAGMTTRVDRVGNLIGATAMGDDRSAFVIGSHFDTVVDAGRYDGTLGILARHRLRRADPRRRAAAGTRPHRGRVLRRGGVALPHRLSRQPGVCDRRAPAGRPA